MKEASMHTTFFRSFYLVFAALFGMLFVATAVVVVRTAQLGEYPATIVGVGVAALCAMLIEKAVRYMRAA
jgi:uncharacterized membrane protein